MARIIFILVVALAVVAVLPARADDVEHYQYAAYPKDDRESDKREQIKVRIERRDGAVSYAARIRRAGESERYAIYMDADAVFEHAIRVTTREDGEVETDSLVVVRQRAPVLKAMRFRDGKEEMKDFRLPDDKPLAVDASLLIMMRRFPFDTDAEHDIFMVDFSQRKVNITLRHVATETVEVPAGSFECHRMEVTVKVFIFRPKITFWITTEAPHFLVKHEGKRGPFTPSFRTVLTSLEAW